MPVASGPSTDRAPSGKRSRILLKYSRTRLRAQYTSVPSSKMTYTKLIPNIEKPRTSVTCGAATNDDTIGYVTWSSTSVGLRPIHSVKTITWGSDRSGMASSLVRRME